MNPFAFDKLTWWIVSIGEFLSFLSTPFWVAFGWLATFFNGRPLP